MGFQVAVRAHAKHNLKLAKEHYQRALDQKDYSVVLFQNFGALLRELGDLDEAEKVYQLGLAQFPSSLQIKQNYSNLLRDKSPLKAIKILIEICHAKVLTEEGLSSTDIVPLVESLRTSGYLDWAYEVLYFALHQFGINPGIAIESVKLIAAADSEHVLASNIDLFEKCINEEISKFNSLQQAEFFYALAWIKFKDCSVHEALVHLNKARSILSSADFSQQDDLNQANKLNDVNNWNASNILLQNQKFDLGWKLFDHGLCTPAKGGQKWQRALPKPFTATDLPLWRGESLQGKSILLLEEQAIGDVMQFLTLIPSILPEASKIGLLVSDRLFPIYKNSFADYIKSNRLVLFSFSDSSKGLLKSDHFDYQSPLGSICQYRFNHPSDFGRHSPILSVPHNINLKEHYFGMLNREYSRIIGISWRGGGTGQRIKEKSIPLSSFTKIMQGYEDTLFVSLQYGDPTPAINSWKSVGLPVLHDSSVNPLKDMYTWLNQVSICDAVISVANTTIHGAGGLHIPTLCLLSNHSDWRWLTNREVDRSYWYPSVGITRQSIDSTWDSAVEFSRSWIDRGCTPDWKRSYTMDA